MTVAEDTVLSFINCYDDAVRAKDAKLVSRALSPDCIREVGPASLIRELDWPKVLSVTQYEEAIKGQLELLESSRTEIISYTADEVNKKGSIHVFYHTKIVGIDEEIVVENIALLDLTDDCTKVKSMYLMADSDGSKKYLSAFTKAVAAAQK